MKHPVIPENTEWGVAALDAKREATRQQQAKYATIRDRWVQGNLYFYDILANMLRFVVEPGRRVLHLRCQTGHLLAATRPTEAVGVDLTEEMIAAAKKANPSYQYVVAEPDAVELDQTFDYILFDQVTDTVDVMASLKNARRFCHPGTRLLIISFNHLWEPVLRMAESMRLKMPQLNPSWLSETDLKNMMMLSGFSWLTTYRLILSPKRVPGVSWLLNRFFAKLPLLRQLCLINVIVARPRFAPADPRATSVSVIVPAKNEEDNIELAVDRIQEMGANTEIIFCDDQSTDGTADRVRKVQQEHPELDIKLISGPGINKAHNVWTGFDAARGDVLMILDADLTVMPEELPLFFDAIVSRAGEFINGSRMVYPMPKGAMKVANMLGNKAFGALFTHILKQEIKDTLCGTKVMWRSDWRRIKQMIGTWGIDDRWGDYELLYGAAKLHLKIVDLPVHYQERIFGATKMVKVFSNGVVMLRMCLAALDKFKFQW